MNDQVHFDSDELFNPTSADSGEEYIPESSEDCSDGTDTSEIFEPVDQKRSMLSCVNLRMTDDITKRCVSPTELNDSSPKH